MRTLPPSLHLKAGRYYFVRRVPGVKVKWLALSRDEAEAMRQYRLMASSRGREALAGTHTQHWLARLCKLLHAQAKVGAAFRSLPFELTVDDVYTLGDECGWCCAVTRMEFSSERPKGTRRRPFMPSIDRIDCSLGYTRENCRMVCVITNIALADWGEECLYRLALQFVQTRAQKPSNGENALPTATAKFGPIAPEFARSRLEIFDARHCGD